MCLVLEGRSVGAEHKADGEGAGWFGKLMDESRSSAPAALLPGQHSGAWRFPGRLLVRLEELNGWGRRGGGGGGPRKEGWVQVGGRDEQVAVQVNAMLSSMRAVRSWIVAFLLNNWWFGAGVFRVRLLVHWLVHALGAAGLWCTYCKRHRLHTHAQPAWSAKHMYLIYCHVTWLRSVHELVPVLQQLSESTHLRRTHARGCPMCRVCR